MNKITRKTEFTRLWNRARTLFYILSIKAFNKKPYPFYVNLVINSRCNLNCAYCFGHYSQRQTPDWKLEDLKKLIDNLYKKGTRYILVQGGEPLLHNDLGEIFKYIYEKGIVTAIVTNGQFPERIKKIPEISLLDNICFSLDGGKEGNDIVRGKGCFDKVMESIEAVKEFHKVPIRINSTISKYVVNDIDFMAEFVKKNKIEWGINYLFKGNEVLGEEDLAPTADEIIEYQRKILEYKRKGYPIFTTTKILNYVLNWPVDYRQKYLNYDESSKKLGNKAIKCQYGFYEIVIDEDGLVYPCQGMQGCFDAKNIHEVGFDEAFKHLETKPCYTCYLPSLINTSAMINWDFNVIGETVFETFKNRFQL
ncbi:MAG: radical SAM protein [Candidatus Gastranaerophilales bacterium]|nr:radical SAM protein [Candidatus Gastranaerophilales bacterium]